jgi:DNA-binding SARP family transcriptional activator
VIKCRTLGPVEVSVDGEPAPPELLWRKHLALLIYLARSPRLTRSREHLVALLWGDKPEQAARHSLNEALRVLRRCCGEDALATDGDTIRLDREAVALDLDEFEQLAKAENWTGAASLVAGEFLEGFSIPGCSPFEEWLSSERTLWRGRGVEALASFSERATQSGALSDATAAALSALELGPLSDRSVRAVMRCLALAGDRPGALAHYDEFSERLAQALDATPEADTVTLATNVRAERVGIEERSKAPEGERHHSRRAPLIGRAKSLEPLLEAWSDAVANSHSSLLIIEGDGGIGKTRLVNEVAARVRLDGGAVVGIRAVEGDQDVPEGGLVALARGGMLETAGVRGAPPQAVATLAKRIPEWANRFPEAANTTSSVPLRAALSEICRAIVEEQPLLIVVDDVHWLDHDSLVALLAYSRDMAHAPFAILVSTLSVRSPDELERVRASIGRDTPGAVTGLTPWNMDALLELAGWYLPEYTAQEIHRVVRRLATDSAGLPLLAVELLHAVTLGLDLREHPSAWPEPFHTLDETLPGGLPDAVRAAVRIGYRQLDPEAQLVLAAVAVIGDRVTPELVATATALELPAVHERLDRLEWHRWLMAESRGYSFVARLPRDIVVEDMLTQGQRSRLRATAGLPETTA